MQGSIFSRIPSREGLEVGYFFNKLCKMEKDAERGREREHLFPKSSSRKVARRSLALYSTSIARGWIESERGMSVTRRKTIGDYRLRSGSLFNAVEYSSFSRVFTAGLWINRVNSRNFIRLINTARK